MTEAGKILELSNDETAHILSFCDSKTTVTKFGSTCSKFYAISSDDIVWTQLLSNNDHSKVVQAKFEEMLVHNIYRDHKLPSWNEFNNSATVSQESTSLLSSQHRRPPKNSMKQRFIGYVQDQVDTMDNKILEVQNTRFLTRWQEVQASKLSRVVFLVFLPVLLLTFTLFTILTPLYLDGTFEPKTNGTATANHTASLPTFSGEPAPAYQAFWIIPLSPLLLCAPMFLIVGICTNIICGWIPCGGSCILRNCKSKKAQLRNKWTYHFATSTTQPKENNPNYLGISAGRVLGRFLFLYWLWIVVAAVMMAIKYIFFQHSHVWRFMFIPVYAYWFGMIVDAAYFYGSIISWYRQKPLALACYAGYLVWLTLVFLCMAISGGISLAKLDGAAFVDKSDAMLLSGFFIAWIITFCLFIPVVITPMLCCISKVTGGAGSGRDCLSALVVLGPLYYVGIGILAFLILLSVKSSMPAEKQFGYIIVFIPLLQFVFALIVLLLVIACIACFMFAVMLCLLGKVYDEPRRRRG